MKMKLRFSLILLGSALLYLAGCKKDEQHAVTITGDYTNSTPTKDGAHNTGYFTTTGAFKTSGTTVMDIHISGDSSHCTASFTSSDGSFSLNMNCSDVNMTGHWNITSGTGRYRELRGEGSLTMSFPPDTPAGVIGVEVLTGEVWMH